MIGPVDRSNLPISALHRTNESLSLTQQRLATGSRINRAEDDSAGYSISSRLQSQIRGLTQGIENADLGLARLDVAGGALNTADDLLGRASELAVQAASDTMSADERAILDNELSSLLAELDALHGDTSFNGNAVFGDDASHEVLVDENGEAVVVEGESVSAEALGVDDASLADGASARDALESLSAARDSLAAVRSSYSGSAVALRESRSHVANRVSSLSAANSRIMDADFARESTDLARLQILNQSGLAAVAQSNAERLSVLSLFG